MIRRMLPVMLVLVLLLPQASAGSASVADPVGDEVVTVGLAGLVVPSAMGCYDPGADITHAALDSDGTTLTITIDLMDLSAAPACTPEYSGETVALERDTHGVRAILRGAAGYIGAYASTTDGKDDGTSWFICNQQNVCMHNLAPSASSPEIRWTVPLTGSGRCGATAMCPIDLRGATFNALFTADSLTQIAAPGSVNPALSGIASDSIWFNDSAGISGFTA